MRSRAHTQATWTRSSKMASTSRPSSGRPRESPVWDYYIYNDVEKKSICQVPLNEEDLCGKSFSGRFTSNLKHHLRTNHKEQFAEVEKKDKARKEAKEAQKKAEVGPTKQATIAEVLHRRTMYERDSDRYKKVTRRLAVFVGATNVANTIVDTPEFKELLLELDPRYPTPGRAAVSREIDKVLIQLKANVGTYIAQAKKVSICADIWTKKGMTASFMGVTAHFFSRKDHKRHCVTLAVKRMPSPHTADHVLQVVREVLSDWDILPRRVLAILTDNGSNMVKAFNQVCSDMEGDEDEDVDSNVSSSVNSDDRESQKDIEDFERNEFEYNDRESQKDVEDFERKELEHNIVFGTSFQRVSCFSHTLQLVVCKFNEIGSVQRVLKKVQKLVSKVNKSTKATEMQIAQAGKKLIGNCPTRWSSTYLMVSRLVDVRPHLSRVLEDLVWDGLQASEWKLLESIRNLLEPFAEHTSLCSGEEYTTISNVIPVLMDLSYHMEEVCIYIYGTLALCVYADQCVYYLEVCVILVVSFKLSGFHAT